jgi:DNA-binding NarL/FixJ family response regulator
MATLDPLGIFQALEEDFNRLTSSLESGAAAVQEASQTLGQQLRELDAVLTPSRNPGRRGRPPTVDRAEVVRLHSQGLAVREIAARVGASDMRVSQILREEGLPPHFAPRLEPTARELAAEQRRQDILQLHGQGLIPSAIAAELEVSAGTVYRILSDEGLRPHETPEAALSRQRREDAIRLHQQGVPGAEIARRLGVSEPRVVAILREFRPPPPPKRSQEFERRAFELLPQVESLRRDPSEENIRLTVLALQNLAEDAGAYVASLPEFPREEMEEERWRAGFVRHRALRALEDMRAYRDCQVAMKQAETSALPRLAVQAQQCIDRAMRLLRECCPPPPRPSPLKEPVPA